MEQMKPLSSAWHGSVRLEQTTPSSRRRAAARDRFHFTSVKVCGGFVLFGALNGLGSPKVARRTTSPVLQSCPGEIRRVFAILEFLVQRVRCRKWEL